MFGLNIDGWLSCRVSRTLGLAVGDLNHWPIERHSVTRFICAAVASALTLVYRVLWLGDEGRGEQLTAVMLQAWIFSVNIIVTALISSRLLHMRRQLSSVLSPQDLQIYLGVIAILVESALPLSLAGIAFGSVVRLTGLGATMSARGATLLIWFSLNVGNSLFCTLHEMTSIYYSRPCVPR
jgi:hypothetical protein